MFCTKCGKEVENNANVCPNCGCPIESQTQTPPAPPAVVPTATEPKQPKQGKKDFFLFRLIANAVGALSGVLSIIFGIVINNFPNGSYADLETYGGDAYTGMQNASAMAANNVLRLSYNLNHIVCYFMICFGLALLAFFVSKIFKTLAEKK